MSKIENQRVGMQESEDYKAGWIIAMLGLPLVEDPQAPPEIVAVQQLGWQDYHDREKAP